MVEYVVAYPILLGAVSAIRCRPGFEGVVGSGDCVDEAGQPRPGVVGLLVPPVRRRELRVEVVFQGVDGQQVEGEQSDEEDRVVSTGSGCGLEAADQFCGVELRAGLTPVRI